VSVTILGVDPSSRSTGWGVWKATAGGFGRLVDSGVIAVGLDDHLARAYVTACRLEDIIEKYLIDTCYIEDTWVGTNRQTALMLTRTQGVIVGRVYGACASAPPRLVSPAKWRSTLGFAARSGKDSKVEALAYWSGRITNADEAEGACIAVAGGRMEETR